MTDTGMLGDTGRRTRPGGHFGAWRALASVPAAVGSLGILLVGFGWAGRWEWLVLLAWLGSAAAILTPWGERLAVRLACGFRRLTVEQRAAVGPAWAQALRLCEVGPERLDLYVQRGTHANAFAAGGRSVAVTLGTVREFQARRLGDDALVAILCHEIGHHSTRATRFALAVVWLAAPWRCAAGFLIGFCLARVGRRRRVWPTAAVALIAVAVAVVQAWQRGDWQVAALLGGLAVASIGCPLADAAVGRSSEYAADRFARSVGVGPDLAAALRDLGNGRRAGLLATAVGRHPNVERRVERLQRPT